MPERKEFLVGISICCLLGWSMLPLIQYGPLLQDPEFDHALTWAENKQFGDIADAKNYPFSSMTRAQSAPRFSRFAETLGLQFIKTEQACMFSDIYTLDIEVQKAIVDGCRYGFFQ